jgi:hypothetical protein
LVEQDDWADVASTSTNGQALDKAKNLTWWKKLEHTVQLLQPICDAIHTLQTDSALLSQVRPVWTGLIKHAEQWSSQLSTSCTQLKEGVMATLKTACKEEPPPSHRRCLPPRPMQLHH